MVDFIGHGLKVNTFCADIWYVPIRPECPGRFNLWGIYVSQACNNCNGDEIVSVSIPCPECVGSDTDELTALRALADYVRLNTLTRSRPSADLVAKIGDCDRAQGYQPLKFTGWWGLKAAREVLRKWKASKGADQ